ncbi:MAG TPA: PAS domain S-box protein [Gammaproteobacteria bacterium]|nr:PAS domain S-box protein [Gammaproteobacteria bacterium]
MSKTARTGSDRAAIQATAAPYYEVRVFAERALEESRRQYQELVNESRDGIYQRDESRRFLFVNPSLCRMLGYEAGELLQLTIDDICDPDDPDAAQVRNKADEGGEIPALMNWRFRHRDGHWVPVETSARRLEDGRLLVTVRDVSERVRAQEALAHQRDLYAALSETGKAIIGAENRERLFEDVCRIAVQYGKLRFAAIYLIDPADRRLHLAARCGEAAGYADGVTMSIDASHPEGRGPTGTAARSGEPQVCNDYLESAATAPWHDCARRAGIEAMAAFPLREAGEVVGTLNLYAGEPGYFTDELLPTLRDMAGGLSHALNNFTREAERRKAEAALHLGEERFRTLVEATSNIVWLTDARGVTVSASKGFEEVTGLDSSTALGFRWLSVVHPDDRQPVIAAWRYASENRVAYTVESRSRMQDGSYRWFSVHGEPIFEPDGSIREWIGTCTDINDQKLAHGVLRDSRQQYLELVEGSRDGIYQRDADGRLLFVNTALCRMLGYEHDELLRKSIHEIADLDAARIEENRQQQDGRAGSPTLLAIRLKHRNGSYVPVETNAKQLASGRTQVMVRDISARVAAERRLEDERKFIMHSMNSLPGIFYVHDAQGRLMRWNERLEQVTGLGADQLGLMEPAGFVTEACRDEALAFLHRTFAQGEADAEMDLKMPDGRDVPYHFNARRFTWQGRVCVAGVAIDISERREAEARERRYIHEARELSRRLLTAQEQERRGIARELHDEVGSALTALQMQIKGMEDKLPEDSRHLSQESREIVRVLLKQARDMSLDLRPSVLDDLGLTAAVNWYSRERLRPAGLQVEVDAPAGLGRLAADVESACFRVIQGAAINALRHGHARSLSIRLAPTAGALILTVQDDGEGFDVTAARARATGGASLGLLAMEERARLVGGEFSIESTPGAGTTVHMLVPMHGDPEAGDLDED